MPTGDRGDLEIMQALKEVEHDTAETAWRGIELCREGNWQEGLYHLSLAAEADVHTAELPGLLFSYLGFGMAKYQSQHGQGLELCKLGVRVELYQPESYVLLARTHLLVGDRRAAWDAIEDGLQVDATHRTLLQLKDELGRRRRPIFPFLPRRHPLNRWLGKLRHGLLEILPRTRR